MKKPAVWLFIYLALFLGGCGATGSDILTNLVKLPTGEIVTSATSRHGSAERAYISRMSAVKAALDLEKVKEEKKDQIIIKIDSKDEMTVFALYEANKNMLVAVQVLGNAIQSLAGRPSNYEVMFQMYEVPEGAFAEGIKAVGKAGKDLLGTVPASLWAGGYAFGKVMEGWDAGRAQTYSSEGGDINVTHRESAVAIGDGNTETVITDVASDRSTITEVAEEEVIEEETETEE